jgi:hypothetical protein
MVSVINKDSTVKKQKNGRVNITTVSIFENSSKQIFMNLYTESKYLPIEHKAYVKSSDRIIIGKGIYVSNGSNMFPGTSEVINSVIFIPLENEPALSSKPCCEFKTTQIKALVITASIIAMTEVAMVFICNFLEDELFSEII